MIDLPYVIQPQPQQPPRRIGTAASGMLDIPILGGITVDEARTAEDLLADQPTTFVVEAIAADAIATAEDISIVEAYSIVTEAAGGKKSEDPTVNAIRMRHAARIDAVVRAYNEIGRNSMEAWAVTMIRHRLGQPGCAVADVRAMPRVLLQGLWGVVADEKDCEKTLPEPAASEADLKKPRPDDGDGLKQPIGTPSSGDSPTDSLDSSTEQHSDEN